MLPNKSAYVACSEFEQYMNEFLARGRESLNQEGCGETRRENLLTALLRSSRESGGEKESQTGARIGLEDREIKGNIFIFLLAGKYRVISERSHPSSSNVALQNY